MTNFYRFFLILHIVRSAAWLGLWKSYDTGSKSGARFGKAGTAPAEKTIGSREKRLNRMALFNAIFRKIRPKLPLWYISLIKNSKET
jgi:hypothetical protein